MTNITHFITKPELRRYSINATDIEIFLDHSVFPPSAHGCFFAEHITINRGERVIDIGTGSGILAIMAAKMGAKSVYATDTSSTALRIARANALRNNVKVTCLNGSFFAGLTGKFDVIIANLPQELVHPKYAKSIGNLRQTIDGGKYGNEILIHFLCIAHRYMHDQSRLYIPMVMSQRYEAVLPILLKYYNVQIVGFTTSETKEFFEEFIDDYEVLRENGWIQIFNRGGKWLTHEFVFKLTKKQQL